jgi:hypothetical protein
MASNSQRSTNNDDLMDDIIHGMALVRPTVLPSVCHKYRRECFYEVCLVLL